MQDKNILVWLPTPMGDAILCTPALRAIRRCFKSANITFFANPVVREILSPCEFNDTWLNQQAGSPPVIAKLLKDRRFTHAILFKNSFASALTAFLARIPTRIGYARQGRGFLLTHKLYPPKLPNGKFKPASMIDYYLSIASSLGADTSDRTLQLDLDPPAAKNIQAKLPEIASRKNPLVIIVPGGAFGPSKCWPSERFAEISRRLIDNYNAAVVVSVSPAPAEKQIAKEICQLSSRKLINLAGQPLNLNELKSLFSIADLVISNDTGPRHIAIALRRKIITLFGPNDPAWTDTGYENEIQIAGIAPCAPCARPACKKPRHLCMESITVEQVYNAAKQLLENGTKLANPAAPKQNFLEPSNSFFVDADYKNQFDKLGLTSVDAVFAFDGGKKVGGNKVPQYRSRLRFQLADPPLTMFLKRYNKPAVLEQLKNWFWHRSRKSTMFYDIEPVAKLAAAGINTPKIISYGEQWGLFFEKRSFTITQEIPKAKSLEERLPPCFKGQKTAENLRLRRNFIKELALLAKKFHDTGCRHRDFYFSHIFYSDDGIFYIIDLQRIFTPSLLAEKFRIKDIAQLYYSAPGSDFSKTDRLRFYKSYAEKPTLDNKDKTFIRKVAAKVGRMARHDAKHGRIVPFTN